MPSATAIPESLRQRIVSYPLVAGSKDVEATGQFLTDDFIIVFLYPAAQTVSEAEWLDLVPEIETRTYQIVHETITLSGDSFAVHQTLVHMETTMRGVERSGEFTVSDNWVKNLQGTWMLWQRMSTPLTAATLPV